MIACAVLAAGGSRRLGRPKQLVTYEGEALVVRAARACDGLGAVAVVLGAEGAAVLAALDGLAVTALPNEAWSEGMASSVRVATRWAAAMGAEALLLHLVDQPLVDAAHLTRLVEAFRAGAPLVGTGYEGVVGAPAIFGRGLYAELSALTGDRGAAPILRAHAETVALPGPGGAVDVDTPSDLARLQGETKEHGVEERTSKLGTRSQRPT